MSRSVNDASWPTECASGYRRCVTVRVWLLTFIGLLLAWAGAVFGPATLLALLVLPIGCVALCSRRQWVPLVCLGALSPIAFATVVAVISYVCGSARLRTSGLPSIETYNVDPATRFQRASSGCLVDGSQLVWQIPNNLVLRLLSATFGPMQGAYDGPFPSQEESDEALVVAVPISWDDIRAGLIPIGVTRVRLRAGVGVRLCALQDPLDSAALLGRYTGPTLLFHGVRDEIVPFAHAERLVQLAQRGRLHKLACGHNDCAKPWGEIRKFLASEAGLRF